MSTPTKEQQLEALDWAIRLCIGPKHEHVKTLQHIRDQIASAEPVAWLSEKDGKYLALSSEPPAREDDAWRRDHGISVTPLYALPEPRAASKIPPFDKLNAIRDRRAVVIPAAERVDVERVRAAAQKFDDVLSATGGCTDGNCIVQRPTGMHTNGGCRCYDNRLKAQRVMRAARLLRDELTAVIGDKT